MEWTNIFMIAENENKQKWKISNTSFFITMLRTTFKMSFLLKIPRLIFQSPLKFFAIQNSHYHQWFGLFVGKPLTVQLAPFSFGFWKKPCILILDFVTKPSICILWWWTYTFTFQVRFALTDVFILLNFTYHCLI